MVTTRKRVAVTPAATKRSTKPAEAATKRRRVAVSDDDSDDVLAAPLNYFASTFKEGLQYISSGCITMDCALGGGWVLGRVSNVVGDKSAGKTLLAIEACANFHRTYPDGAIRYAEAESAFDENYADALGMPTEVVDFGRDVSMRTVEDWYDDMVRFLEAREKDKKPGLYVLDSFDALSDEAEMEREIDKGSYGGSKAKKSGELFRKLIERIEKSKVHLMVVSQIRDKLNVTFGETKTRSGGRALDFYATHIVWLAEIGKLDRTINKVKRIVGVNVRAKVKKNKVGLPFRECDYPIIFGYGVDDLTSSVEWLLSVGRDDELLEAVGMTKAGYKVRINNLRDKGGQDVREVRQTLNALVRKCWSEIDVGFLPKASKY